MNMDQHDVFGGGKSTEEIQLEKAIEVVECAGYIVIKGGDEAKQVTIDYGYKVIDPIIVNDKILTMKDLGNYFYSRVWSKYPERRANYFEGSFKTELRLLNLFISSRMERGLNRINAIQECVRIIDIIFDYEEEFGFKNPIDIGVLGQDKSGWITDKALSILSRLLLEKRDLEVDIMMDKAYSGVDLEQQSNKLNKLLTNMEENNGK